MLNVDLDAINEKIQQKKQQNTVRPRERALEELTEVLDMSMSFEELYGILQVLGTENQHVRENLGTICLSEVFGSGGRRAQRTGGARRTRKSSAARGYTVEDLKKEIMDEIITEEGIETSSIENRLSDKFVGITTPMVRAALKELTDDRLISDRGGRPKTWVMNTGLAKSN